jgi:hypothetical protein
MAKIDFWKLISGREVGVGYWNIFVKQWHKSQALHGKINWKVNVRVTLQHLSFYEKYIQNMTMQMLRIVYNLPVNYQLQRIFKW